MCVCVCVCVVHVFPRLKKLSLSNTQVTDAGLPSLRCLQELLELCLDRTAVTSRGVAALVTCLPHLQVSPYPRTHTHTFTYAHTHTHTHSLPEPHDFP